jgi:hypothetical protein
VLQPAGPTRGVVHVHDGLTLDAILDVLANAVTQRVTRLLCRSRVGTMEVIQ